MDFFVIRMDRIWTTELDRTPEIEAEETAKLKLSIGNWQISAHIKVKILPYSSCQC